jgi:NADPH:quinone reductase-like Zn-dependent oxidoreductase
VSRRVQFDQYGPADVLHIVDVPRPTAGDAQILVRVAAAGINPGEIAIRNGALEQMFPATFPSGQGSDFAGRVVEVGSGVTGFAPGDEVIGWSDSRSAQADYVLSDPGHLTAKPPALDWIRAGALWAIGVTSFSAVRAVALRPGEVVAVSAAAGGVGGLAAQLARRAGARVLGIASPASAGRLRAIGVEPVAYGDGLADRLRSLAPDGIDAFIDTHGDGYVDLAVALGVAPGRIDTIIDFAAAQRHATKTDASPQASTPEVLATMADHVAWGRLTMPIAAIYPLEQVRDAYTELAGGHVDGKIVLSTEIPAAAPPLRKRHNPMTQASAATVEIPKESPQLAPRSPRGD